MKKKTRKVIYSLVLTLALVSLMFIPSNAKASSNPDTPVIQSLGNCIDSDTKITSGYTCSITLTMDRPYYSPYFRAGAIGNSNNMVSCEVTFPNGITYDLGTVTADGSTTPYLHYTGTAPAGDYVFDFQGTDSGTTGFLAFMYSNF